MEERMMERFVRCEGCGNKAIIRGERIAPGVQAMPVPLCADKDCPKFGHEMGREIQQVSA